MKIYSNKADGFITGLAKSEYFSALVYGPDSGGVSNIISKIIPQIVSDPKDPFSTSTLDAEKVAAEPSIIFDEMSAISFFGGRKLVLLKIAEIDKTTEKDVTTAIEQAINELSADAKKGSFLLISAGDLAATSPLRKLYEFSKAPVAAIPCYIEDEKDLSMKANRLLRQKGLQISQNSVVQFLAESCQGDSKIIESEIEKLQLYLGERKEVTFEDVVATTGNSTETEVQDIVNLLCDNEKGEMEIALQKAFASGVQPIAIIRTIQRYFEKLHTSANRIANENISVEEVVKAQRLFFKQEPIFRKHLNTFLKKKSNDIWENYSILYQAESDLKKTDSDPELITSVALAKIA